MTLSFLISFYMAAVVKAELILTGAMDGPLFGGNPKFVELFATTNVADLSIYTVAIGYNGASTGTAVYTFPAGSVPQGTYIYVAAFANNGDAGYQDYFNCTPDYLTSASLGNGDDAYLLPKNGIVIDTIGKVGVDGTGKAWEYLDGWIKRKNVSTASTPSVTFQVSEWDRLYFVRFVVILSINSINQLLFFQRT